jgi:protein-S-isoprenylcysteine O-methyltransferase Ste14
VATLIAWAGGAAFVAALGYLVYFYAVALASPEGARGGAALVAGLSDAALFAAFALHHSLFARPGVKARLTAIVPPRLERTLYVWCASALLVVVCAGWQPVAGHLYRVEGELRWLLSGLQLAGVAITAVATRAVNGLSLAGIQQATGRTPREDSITSAGPFALVRHPIYLGWVLMVGAAPSMTANRLLFAILSVSYLILAIPWEETSLVAAHGDRYRAYQQAVRWRLIPKVW